MSLRNVSRLLLSTAKVVSRRSVPVTSQCRLISDKAMPGEGMRTGYSLMEKKALEMGEDPFESANRDEYAVFVGSGTKNDPFLVPSRNNWRVVCFDPGDDRGPPPCFIVTAEEGGRCPLTGRHYKLQKVEGDKWGIDELDMFAH